MPAEGARVGDGRPAEGRRDSMLLIDLMALCAIEQCVRRDGLRAGDFRMTGGTLFRSAGRFRRVRVVATDARLQGIVRRRFNLGKARRARGVVPMTKRATASLPRRGQTYLRGRIHVSGRRPVTHFTSDVGVLVSSVGLGDVVVAHRARLPARIFGRQRGDCIDSRCPIVAQLPESLGDQKTTRGDKGEHREANNDEQAIQLLRHCHFPVNKTARVCLCISMRFS